ncbi:unnamed protein product [Pieris macdunnoughi]|uniref:PDEase domain-containing protein n=1 Tax=Pieris macdunnoughi TaxID=345717 RepID=A0A821L258_9NEOP|nr:unnamed protein product [Pieris macdunnoughi]
MFSGIGKYINALRRLGAMQVLGNSQICMSEDCTSARLLKAVQFDLSMPIREHLEPAEIMASLLAAIAHDMDHPGVNQPFLIATSNHLAALYQNTSVLENHHWRSAISCLIESGLLDRDVRVKLERQISSLILATDITRQQEYLSQFKILLPHFYSADYCAHIRLTSRSHTSEIMISDKISV